MRIRLHERILHGFVGVGRIPQIVPGDSRRAALLPRDDLAEQFAGRVVVACRNRILNLRRQNGLDLSRSAAFLEAEPLAVT